MRLSSELYTIKEFEQEQYAFGCGSGEVSSDDKKLSEIIRSSPTVVNLRRSCSNILEYCNDINLLKIHHLYHKGVFLVLKLVKFASFFFLSLAVLNYPSLYACNFEMGFKYIQQKFKHLFFPQIMRLK